jgi:hypothetical protein
MRRSRTIFSILAAVILLMAVSAGTALAARPIWTFSVALEGAQEPQGGDPNATGRAVVLLHPDAGLACFNIGWMNIDGAVWGGHIHEAPAGVNGPIVVHFFGGPPPEANTDFSGDRDRVIGCVEADGEVLSAIVANPSGFYVNLHSDDFPGGAIRGQLG